MKMIDIHGKPIVNSHQAIDRQIKDEGLDEIDLGELYLLDLLDECGDYDEDWELVRDNFPIPPTPPDQERFSCYDDEDWELVRDNFPIPPTPPDQERFSCYDDEL